MLKKISGYQLDIFKLEKLFSTYIKDNYNYTPKINISLNNEDALPISLEITEEDSEDFFSFFVNFKSDIASLNNKFPASNEEDEACELGDKLLQLCLNKKTLEYTVLKYDLIVLVDDENPLEFSQFKKDSSFNELKEKIEVFKIKKSHLDHLFGEKFKLLECEISSIQNSIFLEIEHIENAKCSVLFNQLSSENDNKLLGQFKIFSYCHKEAIVLDLVNIFKEIINIVCIHNSLEKENISITKDIILLPIKVNYLPSLTNLENVVLSLLSKHFGYKEIAILLDRSELSINNTVQRIRKKGLSLLR